MLFQTNSNASAFIPQEARFSRGHLQPTMASAIGYGKPELSTLLESGTFYFALTEARLSSLCHSIL